MLATHSNAREVYFHYRNLTDGQIDLLASCWGRDHRTHACSLLTGAPAQRQASGMAQTAWDVSFGTGQGQSMSAPGLDLCHNYELARRELETGEGRGYDALADHGGAGIVDCSLSGSRRGTGAAQKAAGEKRICISESDFAVKVRRREVCALLFNRFDCSQKKKLHICILYVSIVQADICMAEYKENR